MADQNQNTNSNATVQAIDDLVAQLTEEKDQMQNVFADMQEEIEESTKEDMATMDEALAELEEIEKQADEEENAGQVGNVQAQIDDM